MKAVLRITNIGLQYTLQKNSKNVYKTAVTYGKQYFQNMLLVRVSECNVSEYTDLVRCTCKFSVGDVQGCVYGGRV